MATSTALDLSIQKTGVFRCLECGKCTAVCPVSRYDHRFSPRRTVGRALLRHDSALLTDDRLWACLTCFRCTQVCPAAVAYSDLTLSVRTEARKVGQAAVCTHGEVIHSWMRMMMDPGLQQNRLDWLAPDPVEREAGSSPEQRAAHEPLRVSDDSDTLYYVGCAPYYHVQFEGLGVDGYGVARSTVRVLNELGIEPQVLADERCCGHDLLWEGDVEGFAKLAELNAELIQASGAKRIVTACPECARALAVDYPAHGIELGVEVEHLSELVARETAAQSNAQAGIEGSDAVATQGVATQARSNGDGRSVTFHDPCRLGRHLGVYDAPRQAIADAGLRLVEMPRNRENGQCCGTNGWTHCGAANKEIQACRLREAQATGAEILVTACLKCQIHFKCALQDRKLNEEIGIEIRDLATLLAEAYAENPASDAEGE